VLVMGFDRVYWDGRVTLPKAGARLDTAPRTFTVAQWPRVLRVLHVAWNKVVRRELLINLRFRFESGWYEDVSYTFPVLAAAGRITALGRTCVHYRQRRTGAITRTVGDRHFDIFTHWAHALELVEKYAEQPEVLRPLLFQRMMWHYVVVLRNPERIPPDSYRGFFDRIGADFRKYRPAEGYRLPPGAEGQRLRLIERGSFRSFRALNWAVDVAQSLKRARRASMRKVRSIAKRARQGAYRGYYWLQLRLPVNDRLALYAAYWYRGVTCNPAAISRKAAELAPDVRNVWVVGRAQVPFVPPGTDYVIAGSLAYFRALARARWMVNNVNWPNWVVKRAGSTHLMTHHGTPLKMMGLDQVDHPAAAKDQDFHAQMRRADRWDFSISANAHTTVAWDRAYPCGYETLEVGYPRNDRLVSATPDEATAVRAKLGIAPSERVVLYAPTHREWLPRGRQVLDVEAFAEELGPDTVLLVRAHYFHVAPGAGARSRRGRLLDVSAYPQVEDLYLAADVMITDYSSAMFDFAVLDRPLVIFAPDWEAYRELRGTYFDLMAQPPGVVTTTFAELVGVLADGGYASGEADSHRAGFRERFCYLDDGRAAERVVRRVLLGEPAL
jgi:CDP-glycerol glycerophosphotransferase